MNALHFSTICDLANEIAERLDHGNTAEIADAIGLHRELFGRYEDIQLESDLEPILRAVWGELYDGDYPF